MILAAAAQQQCEVLDLGIAHDNEEEIETIFDRACSSGIDILLTSGGVSMGDRDFVKPLLEKRGRLHFHKVVLAISCFSFSFMGGLGGWRRLILTCGPTLNSYNLFISLSLSHIYIFIMNS